MRLLTEVETAVRVLPGCATGRPLARMCWHTRSLAVPAQVPAVAAGLPRLPAAGGLGPYTLQSKTCRVSSLCSLATSQQPHAVLCSRTTLPDADCLHQSRQHMETGCPACRPPAGAVGGLRRQQVGRRIPGAALHAHSMSSECGHASSLAPPHLAPPRLGAAYHSCQIDKRRPAQSAGGPPAAARHELSWHPTPPAHNRAHCWILRSCVVSACMRLRLLPPA